MVFRSNFSCPPWAKSIWSIHRKCLSWSVESKQISGILLQAWYPRMESCPYFFVEGGGVDKPRWPHCVPPRSTISIGPRTYAVSKCRTRDPLEKDSRDYVLLDSCFSEDDLIQKEILGWGKRKGQTRTKKQVVVALRREKTWVSVSNR